MLRSLCEPHSIYSVHNFIYPNLFSETGCNRFSLLNFCCLSWNCVWLNAPALPANKMTSADNQCLYIAVCCVIGDSLTCKIVVSCLRYNCCVFLFVCVSFVSSDEWIVEESQRSAIQFGGQSFVNVTSYWGDGHCRNYGAPPRDDAPSHFSTGTTLQHLAANYTPNKSGYRRLRKIIQSNGCSFYFGGFRAEMFNVI